MSRSPILICGLLMGGWLCAVSASPARGEQDGDDGLARKMLTAAEKQSDLQEATVKYGRRAEIAMTILQDEQVRVNLVAEIRDMQATIGSFPRNRRWWLPEQREFLGQKLERDKQLAVLDRELGVLKLEDRRMYEEELAKARANGRGVKPFHREALLNEIQRLNRESGEAVSGLKTGIESAAREGRTTPRPVVERVVTRLASLDAPPAVEREFLPKFIKFAGGDSWLDGKKAPSSKAKKRSSRTKRNRP